MKLINCANIRQEMLTDAKVELTKIYALTGQTLKLVVVQVEGDTASDVYIKNKIKTCDEVGIECIHVKLDNDASVDTVRDVIQGYACDGNVHGLMLQLPLPDHLKPYQQMLLDAIPWYMDVDGLSTESMGRLWSGQDCIAPATAQGVMRLLPNDLSYKNVCVVGRSNLVGKPLIKLLLDRNATVDICHSKTDNLGYHTTETDIVICAIGKPKFFNAYEYSDEFSETTWIDVGINRDKDGKLCGDVDIKTFDETNCDITPVPSGVGLLTTAQLVLNVVKAYYLQNNL